MICTRGGQILYVRKSKLKSKWNLPGGKIEAGETPAQAAVRELSEETGLENLELAFQAQYAGNQVVHHVFMASVPASSEPSPQNEIAACKWLAFNDIVDLKASTAIKAIVRSFALMA